MLRPKLRTHAAKFPPKSVRLFMKKLRRIEILIGGERIKFDPREEISLTNAPLSDIMAIHSEQVAFWYYHLAMAKKHLRRMQHEYDELYARFYITYQDKLEVESNGKYVNDAIVSANVVSHDSIIEAQRVLDNAKDAVDAIESLVTALEHRKSVMMSLGAQFREEGKSTRIVVGSHLLGKHRKE